jgi:PRTRC genetic system protein F
MDPYSYNLEYSNQEESRKKSFFVGLRSCQNTPHLSVNEKIEMLERQYPGLGRTALVMAESASYRTLTALTPNVGRYLGQNLYWYGMDNDEDFIDEMESDGAETREVLMPSDFISAFPSYFFEGESLQRDALQTIANAGDEFGETAKVILSIMDLIDLDASLPDFGNFEGDSVYFSCYVGAGREPDVMGRLIDDFYESTSYGDCFTDLYGIAEVQFDKHSFLKWRDEMEKGFALYSKLDCLMQRISNDQF